MWLKWSEFLQKEKRLYSWFAPLAETLDSTLLKWAILAVNSAYFERKSE